VTGTGPTWLAEAISGLEGGRACALVTVVATLGSAPREPGSKMLVLEGATVGSIGGGHLEYSATARARGLLAAAGGAPALLCDFALGPGLGQCCGGRVALLIERLSGASLTWLRIWRQATPDLVLATRPHPYAKALISPARRPAWPGLTSVVAGLQAGGGAVAIRQGRGEEDCYIVERMSDLSQDLYLFGAGHVGRALARILELLPYRLHWLDPRAEMFPPALPPDVTVEISADPRHDVAAAAPGSIFLVMTHSHALDLEICDQVLRRGDFAFLGLIGSATKRATFLKRLALRGHGPVALQRLTCPIGLPLLTGKEPGTIAVAVAGQLLALSEAAASGRRAPSMPVPASRRGTAR
jgi:xanthine dehydrogenase accessory factor